MLSSLPSPPLSDCSSPLRLAPATARLRCRPPLAAYVPPPLDDSALFPLYLGAAMGFFPVVIASYEFGKRLLIQRQCALCSGSGLVQRTQFGSPRLLKCSACGGFLPWRSWKDFLRANVDVGNGGPLRQPSGQRSVLYDVERAKREGERQAAAQTTEDPYSPSGLWWQIGELERSAEESEMAAESAAWGSFDGLGSTLGGDDVGVSADYSIGADNSSNSTDSSSGGDFSSGDY